MPEISRFFGIIIAMNFNEHPPPHFHARYGNQKALIDIRSLCMVEGHLSPRVFGLVMEWAAQHQAELIENWELTHQQIHPKKIKPLE